MQISKLFSRTRNLVWVQDDDLGSKPPDGDLEGLATQNAYLQEALETCRRDIASMSHQACILYTNLQCQMLCGFVKDYCMCDTCPSAAQ